MHCAIRLCASKRHPRFSICSILRPVGLQIRAFLAPSRSNGALSLCTQGGSRTRGLCLPQRVGQCHPPDVAVNDGDLLADAVTDGHRKCGADSERQPVWQQHRCTQSVLFNPNLAKNFAVVPLCSSQCFLGFLGQAFVKGGSTCRGVRAVRAQCRYWGCSVDPFIQSQSGGMVTPQSPLGAIYNSSPGRPSP